MGIDIVSRFAGTSSSRSDYPKYDVASVVAVAAPEQPVVAVAKKPMEFQTSSVSLEDQSKHSPYLF